MPNPTTQPRERTAPLPDQVMMPLLDRIVRQSLDEDYEVVARRKAAEQVRGGGTRTPSGRPRRVAAAVIAVFGVLVTVAAVQTARNAPEASAGRASLITQIQDRRTTVARLQARLDRLRTANTGVRETLATTTTEQQQLAARIERLEVRTGFAAVTGPGVRITVDDAPGGDVTQVVRDSDLAILVDGLWNAGAEAISVNGKRLTALTAFRNVGPAIHINITPLVPPYTILVIGNPQTLAANLLDSTHGQEWYALKDSLGFKYQIEQADSLSLPAARLRRLRAVRELIDEGGLDRPGQESTEGADGADGGTAP